jgi:hypothetical protein
VGGGEQTEDYCGTGCGHTVGAFVLGIGTGKAYCNTDCYDSGNTGYHCVTNCD